MSAYRLADANEDELLAEIAHRRMARRAGLCDHCNRAYSTPPCQFPGRHRGQVTTKAEAAEVDYRERLRRIVEWLDEHLDRDVADLYREQPLAQDWARVAKVAEEAGEAVDALIGLTGQNPRKGHYGTRQDLYDELADVALTGLYAMQHFTKNADEVLDALLARAVYHRQRIEAPK